MTRFWMICRRPTHAGARTEPRTRYPSLEMARADARHLATAAAQDFVILEAVEVVRPDAPGGLFDAAQP